VWRSARALRDVVIQSEVAKQQCLDQSLDEILIVCLKSFPDSGIVQSQCLRLLGALSFGSDLVRRRTGEKGIMRLVCHSMENHSETESILLHATTAITNLTHNSIDNRSRFLEAGGVDLLIGLMDQYKHSAKFQRQATWALLTLCGTDEVSRQVANHGGASAVLNAMMAHR
jgi:Armadillo/beta-catenin-like repeat